MQATISNPAKQLPVPGHFDPKKVGQDPWRVDYNSLAPAARDWAKKHGIKPSATDKTRIALMIIDAQNTFCLQGFELFVGGRSGTGAIDDNRRFCEFVYHNLGVISTIACTLDTHQAQQIFHETFWINAKGEHPNAALCPTISLEDIKNGVWKVNPSIAPAIGNSYPALQAHALHYAGELSKAGKFALTVWPYHAMIGGIGHALVSSVEEAVFFHSVARTSKTIFEIKGGNAVTENFSILRPEVLTGPGGVPIAQKNSRFLKVLLDHDIVIIAGQAKSHCVAWTIEDLLTEINAVDPTLARKVYLLEDCTSPVVIPGVVDFTDSANAAFDKFRAAGMHVVRSTDPIESWPDVSL
ncbi:MAG: isochorismatase [Candidatus Paceibacterota bacterium]|jgi:nicotinamidase-related amidase